MITSISAVVAVDETGGLAKGKKIPWHVPEDIEHYQKLVSTGTILIGRASYELMIQNYPKNSKVLDSNLYVLTRNSDFKPQYGKAVVSPTTLIQRLVEQELPTDLYVIGGYSLYILMCPFYSHVDMTIVQGEYGCDKFFPIKYLNANFEIKMGKHLTESSAKYKADYIKYERIQQKV